MKMTDEKATDVLKDEGAEIKLTVRRHTPPDILRTWANNVNIGVTFFDIQLSFGVVTDLDSENATMDVRDQVIVGMSPEHAKSLLNLLSKQIAVYEKNFGSIRPHP